MCPPAQSAKEIFTFFWRTHCWLILHKFQYSIREGDYISFNKYSYINLMSINKKIWGGGGGGSFPPGR